MKTEAISSPAFAELPNAVQLGQEGTALLTQLANRLRNTTEEVVRWLTAWSVTSSAIDLPHAGIAGAPTNPRRFA